MKSSVLKWYMFAFLFVSEFIMFAQPGDTAEDETDTPLEGTDPPPTPINSKLIILAIAAIIFSVAYYRRNKQVNA
ncbi:MAG: hypothetical protein ACLGH8_18140 [Bacteroidia bacterium]|jgi:hypothetical protein